MKPTVAITSVVNPSQFDESETYIQVVFTPQEAEKLRRFLQQNDVGMQEGMLSEFYSDLLDAVVDTCGTGTYEEDKAIPPCPCDCWYCTQEAGREVL